MALLARTKSNSSSESFRERYSELSDEIRAKNKREDRLLDIRLKYYEREKNIRLNILRKEQHQLERTRSLIIEQVNRINQDKPKLSMASFIAEKTKLELSIVQLSNPELFNNDWEPTITIKESESIRSIPIDRSMPSTKVVRPHSAV
ncbi:unnamed protein product [Rotaria socialis]|uniref:Uncharacterized protein n=1 Tax=Rotaria socialis TaxID=392032 RepID=A0A821I288_9BILA|nr:unnamed protein product [Rotaria socialis]CAF3556476.1 unnamed protein product [Rotaria socialis]CAF3744540.1 unnamed protein product [Rotaria socialis]CAF4387425.1 unnamed protein product [Rotaria socialis]CAF4693812.1 unnamed protein product [Rotaria socialis]